MFAFFDSFEISPAGALDAEVPVTPQQREQDSNFWKIYYRVSREEGDAMLKELEHLNLHGGQDKHIRLVEYASCVPGNCILIAAKIGIYHTGVYIDGIGEVHFGPQGVFITPYIALEDVHRRFVKSDIFGTTNKGTLWIQEVIAQYKVNFPGSSYDLIRNNCHHGSAWLLEHLGCLLGVPSYINNAHEAVQGLAQCKTSAVGAWKLFWDKIARDWPNISDLRHRPSNI